MRAKWEKWSDDQIGVELAGTPGELQTLASTLVALSRDREQHFHITETGKGKARVADIEISVMPEPADDSLAISSFALPAGTEVRDPQHRDLTSARIRRPSVRTLAAVLLLVISAVAVACACVSQLITVIGGDYRSTLTEGARWGCLAFVLLQAAALIGKGWKLRLFALLGSLVAASAVLGVVSRLVGLARHP